MSAAECSGSLQDSKCYVLRDIVAGKSATYGHTQTRENSAAEKSCSQGLAERAMKKSAGARGVRPQLSGQQAVPIRGTRRSDRDWR